MSCVIVLNYLVTVAVRDVDVLWLTNSNPDGAEGGALEGLDGDVQRGPGELGVIDKHHPVPWDDATILEILTNIRKREFLNKTDV